MKIINPTLRALRRNPAQRNAYQNISQNIPQKKEKHTDLEQHIIFGVNFPFKMTDICAHVPFRPHQNHSDVPGDNQERLMKHDVSVQTEYCDCHSWLHNSRMSLYSTFRV